MTSNLNMNENHVKNMLDPSDEQDAVNKRFLEARLDDYLSRKVKNSMVAHLGMDGYVVNI